MLLLFVDALTLALPVGLVWTALFASLRQLAHGKYGPTRAFLVWSAIGLGGALVEAVLRETTAWINREQISLVLLTLAVVVSAGFLTGLWRRGRLWQRGRLWRRRGAASVGTATAWTSWLASALGFLLALAALPEVFLLGTGIAQPGVTLYSSEVVRHLAGYVLGLTVVVVACWAVHRAAAGCPAWAVRVATTAILIVAMVDQATTVVQILLARRLIPLWPWLFDTIVWVVNHEDWFTYALMALALAPIIPAWWVGHVRSAGPFANPAERRIVRAQGVSRRRFLATTAAAFGAAVVTATAGRAAAEAEPTLSPPEDVQYGDDTVWVDVSDVDDGHLHRFAYAAATGVEVRFIVIKKNANAFGVALDACELCGPTGFYERGDKVICLRCDVAMNIPTIGFKGGCNPIPIEYTVSDAKVVVARSVLDDSAEIFA